MNKYIQNLKAKNILYSIRYTAVQWLDWCPWRRRRSIFSCGYRKGKQLQLRMGFETSWDFS